MVGAGLAGLTCAKVLKDRGAEVAVFEASDGVGGRVRTDEREGFLLDRGFQVYFTSYPVSKRHLDHGALDFRVFDPGAVVHRGSDRSVLSDPVRDPKAFLPTLLSGDATFGDKLRTMGVAAKTLPGGATSAGRENGGTDVSTLEYLRSSGLSERYIDSFFRPFYGGITLNRTLTTSSRILRFTFRMLATGRTVVPALGMGEIPKQLAGHLPENNIHLNTPVETLLREDGRVRGVSAAGRDHEADAVVVATDAPAAGRLSGEKTPEESVGEVCLYYETSGLDDGKKILLNAEDAPFVNNASEMSNVSERYAPAGRHLLYAVALSGFDLPDERLLRRGVEDVSRWYPDAEFRPLGLRRIPYGQFAQPPGVHEGLPGNRTETPGLFLAGEYTEDSSINGSMLSGERAAQEVLG
ncbi:MAG: Phytoene dehydrogenase and related proteins [uncultured Rubrobacteraceae bacterium]|uniref:Phytoene dehydrogenase and related proteins n=1 Tax=uncultured Rubrobacteraceae bacterium TaxID=349277 RepID=A0A6J4P024_9ACTN|nr:MAG: Phytoene dehydrogenase and related proteins [uncultured Rubrobacteraceae bacterium]